MLKHPTLGCHESEEPSSVPIVGRHVGNPPQAKAYGQTFTQTLVRGRAPASPH